MVIYEYSVVRDRNPPIKCWHNKTKFCTIWQGKWLTPCHRCNHYGTAYIVGHQCTDFEEYYSGSGSLTFWISVKHLSSLTLSKPYLYLVIAKPYVCDLTEATMVVPSTGWSFKARILWKFHPVLSVGSLDLIIIRLYISTRQVPWTDKLRTKYQVLNLAQNYMGNSVDYLIRIY